MNDFKERKANEGKEKAEDEDYQSIDAKFNEKYDQLEADLACWSSQIVDGNKPDKAFYEKYFAEIFSRFTELREYVNNYTFAIPPAFFAGY